MRYLVKKEFIAPHGTHYEVGSNTIGKVFDTKFTQQLIANGFIEEVKDDKRWRAEPDSERFYYVSCQQQIIAKDAFDFHDCGWAIENYKSGNYFKSKATAEKVAGALKLFFEWLHDLKANNVDDPDYSFGKTMYRLCSAMDNAREAVLDDDKSKS